MSNCSGATTNTAAINHTKYSPAALGAAAAVIVAAQKQQQRISAEEDTADNIGVDVGLNDNFIGSFQQSFFTQADADTAAAASASRAVTNPTPPAQFVSVSLPPRMPSASAMHSPNPPTNNASPFLKSFSTPPLPIAQYEHTNHIMQQQQQEQFCQSDAIRQFLQNQRQQKQLQQIQQQPQNHCQPAQSGNNSVKQTNKNNSKQQQQQKQKNTSKQQQKVQMALRTGATQQQQQRQPSAVMQQQVGYLYILLCLNM